MQIPMKHYYYFIRQTGKFSPEDFVYKVAVGSSQRDQVKLELVRQYAADCGMYFHEVSTESDNALDLLASSLFKGTRFSRLFLKTCRTDITTLYRTIIDWSWQDLEASQFNSSMWFRQMMCADPKYMPIMSKSRAKPSTATEQRKNLSADMSQCPQFVAINFGLILFLFLLDSFVNALIF